MQCNALQCNASDARNSSDANNTSNATNASKPSTANSASNASDPSNAKCMQAFFLDLQSGMCFISMLVNKGCLEVPTQHFFAKKTLTTSQSQNPSPLPTLLGCNFFQTL